jgi:hypothetical protein
MKCVNEKKKQETRDSSEKASKKIASNSIPSKIKGKLALKKNWNFKKKEEKWGILKEKKIQYTFSSSSSEKQSRFIRLTWIHLLRGSFKILRKKRSNHTQVINRLKSSLLS